MLDLLLRHQGTAYADAHGEVTYDQLNRMVRQYATMLQQHDVKPGTRGLVVADDSVSTVVAILGLWANGCVPVPVSPMLSEPELAFIADDCSAGFTHKEPVNLDGYPEASPIPLDPDREVLIQYTSGSTGVPKGVLHGMAGIEAALKGFGSTLGLTPDDVVLSTAKLSFGYGFGNSLLFPLAAGARAVLLSGPVDPHRVSATLSDHRPTVLFSVPRMYHGLVELAARGGTPDLGSVRLAVSAGEHLPADLHRRFADTFGVPLVNGLGATEVLHIVVATRPLQTELGATGWPVPGVQATIRDDRLHIAGATCALGYLDRPEETARTFAEGGVYTGDVVRRGNAGEIHYVCRADDLLNLGGYRVSPLEIETVARRTPGVSDCAVVGRTDEAGLQEAATYVVPAAGTDHAQVRRAVIRAFRDQLPPFKRPSRVEVLDRLPTTSTGKLARFKLRSTGPAFVCVPYAGGTVQAYTRLTRCLPSTWKVVTGEVSYPPGTTLADAAEAWWHAVGAEIAPGSVLFGHSIGAAVVAEMAHRYGDRLDGVHVIVSAPPVRLPEALLAAVAGGDADLVLDALAGNGLLPRAGLDRDEMRRLVVPRFIADLQLLRDGWKPEVPAVPVRVLVGSDDPVCRPRDADDLLAGWPLAGLHVVEGGHYFCVDNAVRAASLLTEIAYA